MAFGLWASILNGPVLAICSTVLFIVVTGLYDDILETTSTIVYRFQMGDGYASFPGMKYL